MKIRNVTLLLILSFFTFYSLGAESANQILDKTVSLLNKSTGISCSFKISTSDKNQLEGTFKSSGSKFKLETPMSTTWYDGKNMWTSNIRSKQITLINPTASELSESNPFAYLNSYSDKFKAVKIKSTSNSGTTIKLTPVNKKNNIKSIEVTINNRTYLPEKFIVRENGKKVTTITFSSVNIKASNEASIFTCPVASMKGYELVDLR